MNRVREASTMSVPTMRQMLGLKKTASYWLIKKAMVRCSHDSRRNARSHQLV